MLPTWRVGLPLANYEACRLAGRNPSTGQTPLAINGVVKGNLRLYRKPIIGAPPKDTSEDERKIYQLLFCSHYLYLVRTRNSSAHRLYVSDG